MTDTESYDVAVIGLGPVGGVLACLLGCRGHRVVVIERHASPYPLPRAVHFDHEIGRILQACGLGPDLGAITESADVYEWRNGSGQVLLRFATEGMGPSGWPAANMFWQPALEALIEHAAAAWPTVSVRRGWQLEGVEQTSEAVSLSLRRTRIVEQADGRREEEPTGDRHSIAARYVVGCDGANSTVRELLGTTMTDLGFYYDWLIVDVDLHEPRVFDPLNVQICDPDRPTTVVSGGPGRRRWEFMRLPHESIDELNDAARAWELLAPWDVTPENATLERHAVYTFQAKWAENWRVGRVFLAGDAAHLTPPFAGQGMCAGLRDATNLAWKLDMVLSAHASDAVLDAYGTERAVNARTLIEFAVELGKVICVADADEAAQRDEAMAAAMAGVDSQPIPDLPGVSGGIVSPGDPVAGSLFVQGRVRSGARIDRFDDVFGPGWRLVTLDAELANSLPADIAEWFDAVGGRIVTIGTDADDVDGTYAAWFSGHGVSTALQRPDFYLFGTAVDTTGAAALVASLQAMLGAGDGPTDGGEAP
ncbi:MAG: bifunctional 3-(3-hydroxy-phenyl)propionate/3-hydroxycinnamic acid hydroxylase [Acidimicrobiales bacterium]|jgi:2-polyprenyl-6-methoxyphenol hydroxylase-like FAD-dependent oxidoreductase